MSAFFTELFESIFTPGPTHTLLVATNVSFACLQIVLLALLVATYSIHFVILSSLSAGLWWSINWFVAELTSAKAQEEEKRHQKDDDLGEDTETEVETAVDTDRLVGSKDVEPLQQRGEVRDRGQAHASKSETSTEDEWERVSENEKDK